MARLKDYIKEEAPPVDGEFWRHVENFFVHPPSDRNQHDHSKEIRFRVDRKTSNFWQKAREAAPDEWFKSSAQFYRSLMSVGMLTMSEYLRTHESMVEQEELGMLFTAFKELAKAEEMLEFIEIRLQAKQISDKLAKAERQKVMPLIDKVISLADEKERRHEKREKERSLKAEGADD